MHANLPHAARHTNKANANWKPKYLSAAAVNGTNAACPCARWRRAGPLNHILLEPLRMLLDLRTHAILSGFRAGETQHDKLHTAAGSTPADKSREVSRIWLSSSSSPCASPDTP